jgi:predicted dehydrogenase
MTDKLRCAVIGAGATGLEQLTSLSTCPRAVAVAVAEIHPQRSREACERFHIARNYCDYREVLDQPDIDAVMIALPNHLHASVALQALGARKHVLVAPPMGLNAREAAKIAETARKMRRTVMVADELRFNRHTQIAKAHIERGDLGDVYHARCFWLNRHGIPRIGSWYTQKKLSGGGCATDLGLQLLDTCLHLMREFDVVSITAHQHARFGPRGLGEADRGRSEIDPKRPCDVEDYSIALLRLKSGRTIILETSWATFQAPQGRELGLDLYGTQGGVSLFPAQFVKHVPDGLEVIHLNAPKVPYVENPLHHFVACAIDGKRPLVAPEESVSAHAALDAIYQSAATGKEVKLK